MQLSLELLQHTSTSPIQWNLSIKLWKNWRIVQLWVHTYIAILQMHLAVFLVHTVVRRLMWGTSAPATDILQLWMWTYYDSYRRTMTVATGILRLQLWAYYDCSYGRTRTVATGVLWLQLLAYYVNSFTAYTVLQQINSATMPTCDVLLRQFRNMLLYVQGYTVAHSYLLCTLGSRYIGIVTLVMTILAILFTLTCPTGVTGWLWFYEVCNHGILTSRPWVAMVFQHQASLHVCVMQTKPMPESFWFNFGHINFSVSFQF